MNQFIRQLTAVLQQALPLAVACLLQAGCVALHHQVDNTENYRPVSAENPVNEQPLPPPLFDEPPVADPQLLRFAMQAPAPFQWKHCARSAAGRPIQYSVAGEGTFRVLIIGSTRGNDPAALDLTEKLVAHLHENSLIYGGFQALALHTLNPDGAAENNSVNSQGQNINRQFSANSNDRTTKCPEADLLKRLIETERPHRILHIRTVNSPVGIIGSDPDAALLTAGISQSLGFTRMMYPQDIAPGTLEHYCSSQHLCEVITFAFPERLSAADAWNNYQVELLNLLQTVQTALPKTETAVAR